MGGNQTLKEKMNLADASESEEENKSEGY